MTSFDDLITIFNEKLAKTQSLDAALLKTIWHAWCAGEAAGYDVGYKEGYQKGKQDGLLGTDDPNRTVSEEIV
jgi:hypothetical protein